MDFIAVKKPDGWEVSSPENRDCCFCGTGETLAEAVYSFIRQNREGLGITFTIKEIDGYLHHSTVYGRARTYDELGDSEKALVDSSIRD